MMSTIGLPFIEEALEIAADIRWGRHKYDAKM
jgi:hypothetical protein